MNIYFVMSAALVCAFAGGFCAAWLILKLRMPRRDARGRFAK